MRPLWRTVGDFWNSWIYFRRFQYHQDWRESVSLDPFAHFALVVKLLLDEYYYRDLWLLDGFNSSSYSHSNPHWFFNKYLQCSGGFRVRGCCSNLPHLAFFGLVSQTCIACMHTNEWVTRFHVPEMLAWLLETPRLWPDSFVLPRHKWRKTGRAVP